MHDINLLKQKFDAQKHFGWPNRPTKHKFLFEKANIDWKHWY